MVQGIKVKMVEHGPKNEVADNDPALLQRLRWSIQVTVVVVDDVEQEEPVQCHRDTVVAVHLLLDYQEVAAVVVVVVQTVVVIPEEDLQIPVKEVAEVQVGQDMV